jgi:hypothetical protein
MKKIILLTLTVFIGLQMLALPWGHRYATVQTNQNLTVDVSSSFKVSIEWGEGSWDSSSFGYGLSTDGSDWVWVDLPWFEDGSGSNKRCSTDVVITIPGKYYYAYRMVKAANGGTGYSFGSDAWVENTSSISAVSTIVVGDVSTQDGVWYSSTTWESGSIPTILSDVAVMHNVSVSNTGLEASSLVIYSGKTLTINQGGQLSVSNFTTVNGTLSVQSDASGNGSFITNSITGNASVQRYMAAYTVGSDGWHLLSSPLTSFTISGSSFEPTSGTDDLYKYSESTNMWLNYQQSSFGTLDIGEGYLTAWGSNKTGTFTGTLNVADVSYSNLSVTGGQGEGWHALGNPYSSAIAWDDSGNSWSRTGIAATAKVWSEVAGNYADITQDGTIPSTNGFFVQATSGTNSMTIQEESRTHNIINNYKSNIANEMVITVSNSVNSFYDVNRIALNQDATESFDAEFDSHKLYGSSTAPQLASEIDGELFTINHLPLLTGSYELNMEFIAGVNGSYTYSFEGLSSFDNDMVIVLEDKQTQSLIQLTGQNYQFDANTTDNHMRFVLHFTTMAGITESTEDAAITLFSYENLITIDNRTEQNGMIEVYDLTGKVLFVNGLEPEHNTFRVNVAKGVYLVRVGAGEKVITRSIVIR